MPPRSLSCLPLAFAGLTLCPATATAEQLVLHLGNPIDIQSLGLTSIGDLALNGSDLKLWISDGASNGHVFKLDVGTGATLANLDPAAILGLSAGPDALTIASHTGNDHLVVLSPFGESEGGRITQQGVLIADYNAGLSATGADIDLGGNVWIATGTVAGGGSILKRINPSTGAILQSVPILGSTSRVVDLTFDPHTNACYCLFESNNILAEINLTTGAQVSATDLTPFLLQGNAISGGIDFNNTGLILYLGTGTGASADKIVVLLREFATTICDGSGAGTPCPCGNGATGNGCPNSVVPDGAHLGSVGLPSVIGDSLGLVASGMPTTSFALFFQGTTTPETGPALVGDGLLCVTGSVIRLGTKNATGGSAQFPGAGDPSIHVKGLIPAGGGTRFYQVWYRNPADFCTHDTFNFTNGIKVLWTP